MKKLEYMEDVNRLIGELFEAMDSLDVAIMDELYEDKLFDAFQEILMEYSENIDYKNYN